MINRTWHKDEQDLAYTLKKPEVLLGRQTQSDCCDADGQGERGLGWVLRAGPWRKRE